MLTVIVVAWEGTIVDRRALVRPVALVVIAATAVGVALHLDERRPAGDDQRVAGGGGARVALERVASASRPRDGARAAWVLVDESRPHRHDDVDPRTGGLVPLADADPVFPDARELGPVHVDPLPPGVSLDDPTDTRTVLARAGAVDADRATSRPYAAAATAPVGTPSIRTLTQHVLPSCSGTGSDGNRVQVLYVREAGTPSRLASVLPALRAAVAEVDDVFAVSAQQTGGVRRVRWVHDGDCQPVVTEVAVADGALADFSSQVSAVRAQGFVSRTRKYLMFTEASTLCGIASIYSDTALTGNANDGRYPEYARVDTPCWSTRTSVPAHELTHTLGGVQDSAPHATPYGHCYDESDLMCYADGSGVVMQQVCASANEQLLDCNHDDYFSTSPAAGSFLARSWNTASSSFLDTVVSDLPPPAVSLTSSATAVETGDLVRLSATSPATVSWSWSTSAPDCALVPAGGTATLRCPAAVSGPVGVTATATQAGAASTGFARTTLTVTRAAAPSATVGVPAEATAETPVPVSVTATGKVPFGYAWSGGECTPAAPAAASTTLTCPASVTGSSQDVAVVVTQADGQSVRVTAPLRVSPAPTPTPAPTPAPVATRWDAPTWRSGVLSSVLRVPDGVLPGHEAVLQVRWAGASAWADLHRLTTDATGRVATGLRYDRAGRFRFAAPADTGHLASTSADVLVKAGTRTTATRPTAHRVSGRLQSLGGRSLAGRSVTLQVRRSGTTRWLRVATLRTGARGTLTRVVHPAHRSAYRWVFAGTAEELSSRSGTVTVR